MDNRLFRVAIIAILFSVAICLWGGSDNNVAEAFSKAFADNDQRVSIEYKNVRLNGDTVFIDYVITNDDLVVIEPESLLVDFAIYDADTGKKIHSEKSDNWLPPPFKLLPNYHYTNTRFIKGDALKKYRQVEVYIKVQRFTVTRRGMAY